MGHTLSRRPRSGASVRRKNGSGFANRAPGDNQEIPENAQAFFEHLNLRLQYDNTHDISDLQGAVRAIKRAVDITPEDDTMRHVYFDNLATDLSMLFEESHNFEDLQEAIAASYKAIEAVFHAPDRRNAPRYLRNLAQHLNTRYQQTCNVEDLLEAVKALQRALNESDEGAPDRGDIFNQLSLRLSALYDHSGNPEVLEAAIQASIQAVALTETFADKIGYLMNVATCLGRRFDRTGDLDDLQEAIRIARTVVENVPDSHDGIGSIYDCMSCLLSTRYSRTNDITDLNEAIQFSKRAVELTSESDVDLASTLNNLGSILGLRYGLTKDPVDIQEAVSACSRSVETTPTGHFFLPSRLLNLSNQLDALFGRTGDIKDIQAAISAARRGVDVTSGTHPAHSGVLLSLGNRLRTLAHHTEDRTDYEAAIKAGEEAAGATPEGHPNRVLCFLNLCALMVTFYPKTHDVMWLNKSIHYGLLGLNEESGSPLRRVQCGKLASKILIISENWEKASETLNRCIRLLPRISQRALQRDSHENILHEVSGLSSLAASVALQSGSAPSEVAELLELGRGIYAAQVLSLRGDLQTLEKAHPALCEKYKALREDVNRVVSEDDLNRPVIEDATIARRWELLREFESVEEEIRHLPGFERFQLPPDTATLTQLAISGPIVIFVVTDVRSDAVIVKDTGISAIPLPALVYEDLEEKLKMIWGGEHPLGEVDLESMGDQNQQMGHILRWLWDVAVSPVLDYLGFLDPPEAGNLPRMWWVGCGPMSRLPFHAAGYHSGGSSLNTISKVISSYTPTVTSLAHMRRRTLGDVGRKGQGIVVVTMPETPGEADLEIDDEVKAIKAAFPSATVLTSPRKGEVIEALKTCKIVHFACHGEFLPQKPSNSSLLLMGPGDGSTERLSVREVTRIDHNLGSVAYLSACSTAENSTADIADEYFNLAGSFQLAGFPHVVGSLWQAMDFAATELTTAFYTILSDRFQNGDANLDHNLLSEVLHQAIMSVREMDEENVLMWGPFVHIGA